MYAKIRAWLNSMIDDLPPEINYCETDCGRSVCDGENFERCMQRLDRLAHWSAAGETGGVIDVREVAAAAAASAMDAAAAAASAMDKVHQREFVPIPNAPSLCPLPSRKSDVTVG